jgi:hypothetical protein
MESTMSQRPIMPWDSTDEFDPEEHVVWWARLDGRYHVEVHRKSDREGTLFIWDRERGEDAPPAYGRAVNLAYGAVFGPDVDDVAEWQQIALDLADGKPVIQ